jgi:uncharacterized protein YndB with AHSA1/START domain
MAESTKTYTVARETVVSAPADKVHDALADFHAWRQWSPWEGLDRNVQRTYSGPTAGVGAVYEWRGNRKVGAGRMEITGDSPTEVVIALDLQRPFQSKNTTTFSLRPHDGGTQVVWQLVGLMTFGIRIMNVFSSIDRLVGRDFEKGLARLRAYLSG